MDTSYSTHRDVKAGFRAPTLPAVFDALDPNYFSLGRNENYYETLNRRII